MVIVFGRVLECIDTVFWNFGISLHPGISENPGLAENCPKTHVPAPGVYNAIVLFIISSGAKHSPLSLWSLVALRTHRTLSSKIGVSGVAFAKVSSRQPL